MSDHMQPYFEYRHLVGFEETNLIGNVYYTNHVRWQGRCRELFLRQKAPEILTAITDGLVLATARVSCEYLASLHAFDEVAVRMRLAGLDAHRLRMAFDYIHLHPNGPRLVARGEQEIACLRRAPEGLVPAPVPASLRSAVEVYR